jgi:DUF4097 and DUF4098 domain-containing protein YvlB
VICEGKSRHHRRRFRGARDWAICLGAATLLSVAVSAADTHKDLHFNLSPGSMVFVVNQNGIINVRAIPGRQLHVTASQKSGKVEVDGNMTGNRVTLRTHMLQKTSGEDARVDYEIALPSDTGINIDSENGPIKIENIQGNVTVDSDSGGVTISNVSNGTVQVQTVNAPITLNGLKNSRISVTSTDGAVHLNSVTGPKVSVETTNGAISYEGDFAGGGSYTLANHGADIDVKVPTGASLDLTARSVKGSVNTDFPFQKAQHPTFQLMEGRSFAGTLNSGASSVELRSFSGKIRISKQ